MSRGLFTVILLGKTELLSELLDDDIIIIGLGMCQKLCYYVFKLVWESNNIFKLVTEFLVDSWLRDKKLISGSNN